LNNKENQTDVKTIANNTSNSNLYPNLINDSFQEELKAIQKSIALQQQTLYKILNLLESLQVTINMSNWRS
jgi:hypothetical protein